MDIPFLDKCPGYNLFIGGFIALRRPKALTNCNITHIVSVMDWNFEPDNPLTRGFEHFHIPVDDVEDENLIRWFPQSNAFIDKALKSQPTYSRGKSSELDSTVETSERGNGVFIHCAMGKSRSATVLIAYLLWSSRQPAPPVPITDKDAAPLPPKPLSVLEAWMLLRQGRPIVEPNEGFMDQLYMYADMGCPTNSEELESHKLYRRFINKLNVAESLAINRAPDVVDIRFEDDSDDGGDSGKATNSSRPSQEATKSDDKPKAEVAPGVYAPTGETLSADTATQIRCRRCRHVLASTPHLMAHTPSRSDPASQTCAHIFLHPLSWMRETLSEGQLEGRLACPNKKCGANVGKFAWQGLRCSCGGWVTPGFGVLRAKVDEVAAKQSGQQSGTSNSLSIGGGAIRLPPSMRGRGGGNL